MVEHRSSKPYAWVRFLLLLRISRFTWSILRTKPTHKILKNNKIVKNTTTKSFRQLFNTKSKNYRPFFFKHYKVLQPTDNWKSLGFLTLHYHTHLLNLRKLNKSYLPQTNLKWQFKPVTRSVPSSSSTKSFLFQKLQTFTFEFDISSFMAIVTYFINKYLLAKKHLHSKKASIIIAQIVDAGHFARRTVYLSLTQKYLLHNKVKLQKYLNSYDTSLPIYTTTFNNHFSNKLLQSSTTHPTTLSSKLKTLKLPPQHLYLIHTNILTNLIVLYTQYLRLRNNKKHVFKKLLQKTFKTRKRPYLLKKSWISSRKYTKYITKKVSQLFQRQQTNFLWRKKQIFWYRKRRLFARFFRKWKRLPFSRKPSFYSNHIPQTFNKFYRPQPFNYNVLTFINKDFNLESIFNKPRYWSYIPSQLLLIFVLNPYLFSLFLNQNQVLKSFDTYFYKHSILLPCTVHSNLSPHKSFTYVISKKIRSLFSTSKIREDIIPFYYHTLIRFMEHCSGKKILIQLYPFLNQNIGFNDMVRYKMWTIRMKSYERRLGHKFFFEEALHIMHLSFSLRDVNLFSSWLKAMILRISFWKTRTIFRFLRYLFLIYFAHIFPELGIKGLKIRLKGKISAAGNSRKRTILYRVGQTSHSRLNLRVSHSKQTINTFTGVMGFQVWLFY